MLWKLIVFLVMTAALLVISYPSLRNPTSHGFFRFFSWETMLILFLLNVSYWFINPFTWYQWIAWILLFLSIIPVTWGTILLRKLGNPVKIREGDPGLLAFEKTSKLVTGGIYRYIRHPLYCSLLLLAWGFFFKYPSWIGASLVVVASAFLYLTSQADELECLKFFGTEYEEYRKRTKRFIPFLF